MIINSSEAVMRTAYSYTEVNYSAKSTSLKTGGNSYDSFNNSFNIPVFKTQPAVNARDKISSKEELRQKLIEWMMSLLSKGKDKKPEEYDTASLNLTNSATPSIIRNDSYSYYHSEYEEASFSVTGAAITADGRTLSLDLSFTLTRSFMEATHTEVITEYESILTDPLILNLESNPASISKQTFLFDLDSDGTEEEIHMPGSGSGFLALDQNNDGKINNGTELFGTQSGNGFTDLAEYDKDGNGWIDEADEIYNRLVVWIKNEDGTENMLSLKEAGVGAIFLGNVSNTFSVKDFNNKVEAIMRQSGIFLMEDGSTGHIAEYDLAHKTA